MLGGQIQLGMALRTHKHAVTWASLHSSAPTSAAKARTAFKDLRLTKTAHVDDVDNVDPMGQRCSKYKLHFDQHEIPRTIHNGLQEML